MSNRESLGTALRNLEALQFTEEQWEARLVWLSTPWYLAQNTYSKTVSRSLKPLHVASTIILKVSWEWVLRTHEAAFYSLS
jgi:hypothetical protein